MKKILELIKAGDQDVILDENEKIKQLEILLKNEVVSVHKKKLFLTKKESLQSIPVWMII